MDAEWIVQKHRVETLDRHRNLLEQKQSFSVVVRHSADSLAQINQKVCRFIFIIFYYLFNLLNRRYLIPEGEILKTKQVDHSGV